MYRHKLVFASGERHTDLNVPAYLPGEDNTEVSGNMSSLYFCN
jgi:hypothetical protein